LGQHIQHIDQRAGQGRGRRQKGGEGRIEGDKITRGQRIANSFCVLKRSAHTAKARISAPDTRSLAMPLSN